MKTRLRSKILIPKLLLLLSFISCNLPVNQDAKAAEYYRKGLNLLDYKLSEEAIPMFKKAIELSTERNPDILYYYRNLANAFFEISQRDSCLKYTLQALKHCPPNSYDYYYIQGDAKLLSGEIRKGVVNLKKACRIYPDNLEANNTLGLVYLGEYGKKYINYKTGLKYNKRAFEYSKSNTTKSVLASNYYWMDSLENSKKLYQELIEFNNLDLNSKYYLGLSHYESSEYKEAKKLLGEVIQLDTSYVYSIKEILTELEIDFR